MCLTRIKSQFPSPKLILIGRSMHEMTSVSISHSRFASVLLSFYRNVCFCFSVPTQTGQRTREKRRCSFKIIEFGPICLFESRRENGWNNVVHCRFTFKRLTNCINIHWWYTHFSIQTHTEHSHAQRSQLLLLLLLVRPSLLSLPMPFVLTPTENWMAQRAGATTKHIMCANLTV